MRPGRMVVAVGLGATGVLGACTAAPADTEPGRTSAPPAAAGLASPGSPPVANPAFRHQPLIYHLYTADPSGHVFDDRLFIYGSHDEPNTIPDDAEGSQFDMRDYHVFSMGSAEGEVTDHGVALALEDIPWAQRQLWAPDAAVKDGTYYLYFPAKDAAGVFRIGVATGTDPAGPFTAEPEPIAGTFSIDPAVFADDDGEFYLYFGGIWGGQLQRWRTGEYVDGDTYPEHADAALSPKVARLGADMTSLAEEPRDVEILSASGIPLRASDTGRRFFEGAWVYKHDGVYHLVYSTGDTFRLVYATSDSPYGPFTYQGIVLAPVQGWTTHGSIVDFDGSRYLLYHDTQLSGQVELRNIKIAPLEIDDDGEIVPIDPMT